MRRKIVNGINRVILEVTQFLKRARIRLLHPNIHIDSSTFIGKGVKLTALKGAELNLRGVYIKDYAYVYAGVNGKISIGMGSQVGMFNVIVAKELVSIGERVLLAEFVTIRDQDHDLYDHDSFHVSPVIIGDDSWIANKVSITKGVSIGKGSVIGANSVVTRDIPEKSVAVGAPARVIKTL